MSNTPDLGASLDELRRMLPEINKASDEATEVVRAIEREFAPLGLTALVADWFASGPPEWCELVFIRHGGKMRVCVRTWTAPEGWQSDPDDWHGPTYDDLVMGDTVAWDEIARGQKLQAATDLPKLVDELTKKAKDLLGKARTALEELSTILPSCADDPATYPKGTMGYAHGTAEVMARSKRRGQGA